MIGIIVLFLFLAVCGFLVYLIVTYIPMPEMFKQVISVAAAIILILYVLAIMAGQASLPTMPIFR